MSQHLHFHVEQPAGLVAGLDVQDGELVLSGFLEIEGIEQLDVLDSVAGARMKTLSITSMRMGRVVSLPSMRLKAKSTLGSTSRSMRQSLCARKGPGNRNLLRSSPAPPALSSFTAHTIVCVYRKPILPPRQRPVNHHFQQSPCLLSPAVAAFRWCVRSRTARQKSPSDKPLPSLMLCRDRSSMA